MRKASVRLGSCLPTSIALIVWRETSTSSASSACDMRRSARRTRRRLCTDLPLTPAKGDRVGKDQDDPGQRAEPFDAHLVEQARHHAEDEGRAKADREGVHMDRAPEFVEAANEAHIGNG